LDEIYRQYQASASLHDKEDTLNARERTFFHADLLASRQERMRPNIWRAPRGTKYGFQFLRTDRYRDFSETHDPDNARSG
jgi:hypothetical protein